MSFASTPCHATPLSAHCGAADLKGSVIFPKGSQITHTHTPHTHTHTHNTHTHTHSHTHTHTHSLIHSGSKRELFEVNSDMSGRSLWAAYCKIQISNISQFCLDTYVVATNYKNEVRKSVYFNLSSPGETNIL